MRKLTFWQSAIMCNLVQNGVITFSLARLAAENAGTNGWMAMPICGLIAAGNIWLIGLVHRHGEGKSIVEIARMGLPRFMVYPIFALLALFWAAIGCLVIKYYVLILNVLSFQTASILYLFVLMELLVFLLITKGIYVISKTGVAFFGLVGWLFLLYLVPQIPYNLTLLTTHIFQNATNHSIWGWLEIYSAFIGIELCLLLFPFSDKQTKLTKAFQMGNLFTTFIYTWGCFFNFSYATTVQIQHERFPMLNILSYAQFTFAERIDNFIFSLFFFRALFTGTLYGWAAFDTVIRITSPAFNRAIAFGMLVLVAATVRFATPSTLDRFEHWLELFSNAETGVAFGLPLFLLIIIGSSTRRKSAIG